MVNKLCENRRQICKVGIYVDIELEAFTQVADVKEQLCIAAVTVPELSIETVACQDGILDLDGAACINKVQFCSGNMDCRVQEIRLDNHGIQVFEVCSRPLKTVGCRQGRSFQYNIADYFCDLIFTPESENFWRIPVRSRSLPTMSRVHIGSGA